jgi:hypothetical protein
MGASGAGVAADFSRKTTLSFFQLGQELTISFARRIVRKWFHAVLFLRGVLL